MAGGWRWRKAGIASMLQGRWIGEVLVLWLALLFACGSKCEGDDCDSGSSADDTSTPDDSSDDSGPDDSATESGDDSADDSGDDTGDDSGDDSGPDDSGTWTDTPPDCATPVASFHGTDGSVTDLTGAFGVGTFTTLDEPGNLWVCPGTWFTRVILRADIHVIGLGAGPEDTILSAGEVGTILDIGGPHSYTVENVTLDRGAAFDVSHNSGGGGIFCCGDGTECQIPSFKDRSTVVVDDVVFTNNTGDDGAAFYSLECDFDVKDSWIADNHSDDDGGAVNLHYATATFDSVTFDNNEGLDGGVMAMFYSEATITNSVFSNNTGGNYSAGIWASTDTVLNVSDTVFENNVNEGRYVGAYGGAIIAQESATLERVDFIDNTAPRWGGGLFVYWDAVVDGIDCDFSGNEPEDIYAADYSAEGGVSYTAGTGYSFACAKNVCTPK